MSTADRLHRIDTNLRNDRIAQLVAAWNHDTKRVEAYADSINRLLEYRSAVIAGHICMIANDA